MPRAWQWLQPDNYNKAFISGLRAVFSPERLTGSSHRRWNVPENEKLEQHWVIELMLWCLIVIIIYLLIPQTSVCMWNAYHRKCLSYLLRELQGWISATWTLDRFNINKNLIDRQPKLCSTQWDGAVCLKCVDSGMCLLLRPWTHNSCGQQLGQNCILIIGSSLLHPTSNWHRHHRSHWCWSLSWQQLSENHFLFSGSSTK